MFEPSHLIAVSPSGRALIRRKTALPARQVVDSRFIISSAGWKQTESACFVGHTHSLVILSAGGRWEILLRHVWWKYAEQSRGINENTGDCGGLDWNSSPASTSRSFSPWSAAECFKWTHFWNSSDFGGALWKFEVRQHSHRVLLCNGDWHWKRGTGRKTRSQEEAGLLIHHRRRPFSSRQLVLAFNEGESDSDICVLWPLCRWMMRRGYLPKYKTINSHVSNMNNTANEYVAFACALEDIALPLLVHVVVVRWYVVSKMFVLEVG